ncbi:MAG: CDP-alcohol phosphatidyltransferase family protein [Wenzhouxiangellaceae bacterium]|nr:CDP-alcohol phosphatidyltransferase family protein [Wenzhouxiangellaceae bacterium]
MNIALATAAVRSIGPELLTGLVLSLLGAFVLVGWLEAPARIVWAALGIYLAIAWMVGSNWPARHRSFGWPNRVTLLRITLVAILAAALLFPELYRHHGLLMAALAMVVLLLDGVDGWLARALNASSAFGARFDMEADSLLVLVLSIAVFSTGTAGPWVLAIGLLRYLFVGLGRLRPWLAGELPDSARRKWICVIQVLALSIAVAMPASQTLFTASIDPIAVRLMLAGALMLLTASFALDMVWLAGRHRRRSTAESEAFQAEADSESAGLAAGASDTTTPFNDSRRQT